MYKTFQGIVLKRVRFAENSAFITVLTDKGLEKFSAKGILSPKNKNSSAVSLFALSEFVVSTRGENSTLSSASLIKMLIRQGVDFEGLALANYLTTLAHDTAFDEEDAVKIYKLLGRALSAIGKGEVGAKTVKAVFELKLMTSLGFFPDLEFCSRCGNLFHGGVFLPDEGTVLCDKCEPLSDKKKLPLSPAMTEALLTLFNLSEKDSFGIRFKDDGSENLFSRLAEEFSVNHLDCAIGALTYYKTNIENLTGL